VHTQWAIQWKNPVWGAGETGLKMRRALSMTIDRQGLNDLIYGGAGVPSYATPYDFMGLKAPAHWDELGPYYAPNIPEAKRLMAEAGYPNGYDCEMVTTAETAASGTSPVQQQLAEPASGSPSREVESTVATGLRNAKDFKDFISGSQDSGYDMEMNIPPLGGKDAWQLWLGRRSGPRRPGAEAEMSWTTRRVEGSHARCMRVTWRSSRN
jgi:hypothetical protein